MLLKYCLLGQDLKKRTMDLYATQNIDVTIYYKGIKFQKIGSSKMISSQNVLRCLFLLKQGITKCKHFATT